MTVRINKFGKIQRLRHVKAESVKLPEPPSKEALGNGIIKRDLTKLLTFDMDKKIIRKPVPNNIKIHF